MVYARQQAIEMLLCVNKADMDPDLARNVQAEYAGAQVDVLASCALSGEGFSDLRERMQAKRCCFAGQSGVGKSTLLGKLLDMDLKVGDVSHRTERGKHTTRHAELLEGNGLQVFDTPGFSLLGIPAMPPEALQEFYPEMEALGGQCRFQPCLHDREPDCAVRAAVREGTLSRARWERYRSLLVEVKESWRNRYD
ncbi:MAG TPA: ribosome small subunit-dependent GTPase A [Clostridia bacterium]|nr:ribosome small subunit-dependent GTPase A [Clostridia bacterium]